MSRARRHLLVALLMASSVGVVVGVVRWAGAGAAGPLAVNPAEHRLQASRPDQEFSLRYQLSNRSSRPVRIVGARESCGPEGCVEVDGLPMEVPPGGRRWVTVQFRAGVPGDSVKEFPLYTDQPSQPMLLLRVRCTVAAVAAALDQSVVVAERR